MGGPPGSQEAVQSLHEPQLFHVQSIAKPTLFTHSIHNVNQILYNQHPSDNVRHGVAPLHASLWLLSPTHAAPPFTGAFCVRERVRVPPGVHSAEHAVHAPHSFHVQSTAIRIKAEHILPFSNSEIISNKAYGSRACCSFVTQ